MSAPEDRERHSRRRKRKTRDKRKEIPKGAFKIKTTTRLTPYKREQETYYEQCNYDEE